MERLTHEADFGLEDWEETLFFVKSDPDGAYNILDIARFAGEPEFDEILKNIALRLAAYENTGLTPEKVQQMRWVPVEERMPEDDAPTGRKQITVMVATKSGKVTIASRVVEAERTWYDGQILPAKWSWSRWLNRYVTHWMPLPKAPKEESNG